MKQARVLKGLMWITGIFCVSLFWMMAVLRYGNLEPMSDVLLLLLFVSFMLSLLLLPIVVWRAVRIYGMDKMEAWWWLSAPYSIVFPLSILLLSLQEFGHAIAPFWLLYFAALVPTALWLLTMLYKIATSHTSALSVTKAYMLGLVVLSGVLFLALLLNG